MKYLKPRLIKKALEGILIEGLNPFSLLSTLSMIPERLAELYDVISTGKLPEVDEYGNPILYGHNSKGELEVIGGVPREEGLKIVSPEFDLLLGIPLMARAIGIKGVRMGTDLLKKGIRYVIPSKTAAIYTSKDLFHPAYYYASNKMPALINTSRKAVLQVAAAIPRMTSEEIVNALSTLGLETTLIYELVRNYTPTLISNMILETSEVKEELLPKELLPKELLPKELLPDNQPNNQEPSKWDRRILKSKEYRKQGWNKFGRFFKTIGKAAQVAGNYIGSPVGVISTSAALGSGIGAYLALRKDTVPATHISEERRDTVPATHISEERRDTVPATHISEERRDTVPATHISEERRDTISTEDYNNLQRILNGGN